MIPPLNSIPTKKVPQAPFFVGTEEEGFEVYPNPNNALRKGVSGCHR